MNIPIGVVDDHKLFLKSVALMIEHFGGYEVAIEAGNGIELQRVLAASQVIPKILIIDVNMPEMNGVETAAWVNKHYPDIKLVALTMNDNDQSVIKMFRAGCCAYLLKDVHPAEFEKALRQVGEEGYYNSDHAIVNFRKMQLKSAEIEIHLTGREKEFLQLACSELTYRQIASHMNLSERTIDGYRESLFHKFHVQSRVGLCLEALRKEFVRL